MTLKEFFYCACGEVHVIEGEDSDHAEILTIPCEGIDETPYTLSPDLLSREVFLFEAKSSESVTVYLKTKEDKQ